MPTYEQHLLKYLRQQFLEHGPVFGQGDKHILVESMQVEDEGIETAMVVILFREGERPHCLFGIRFLAYEPPPMDQPDRHWQADDDPEGLISGGAAQVIFANFKEQIEAADMGLPPECNPDDITWI